MKHYPFLLTLLIPLIVLSQGCATILGGRTNSMVFTGQPDIQSEVFIGQNSADLNSQPAVLPEPMAIQEMATPY